MCFRTFNPPCASKLESTWNSSAARTKASRRVWNAPRARLRLHRADGAQRARVAQRGGLFSLHFDGRRCLWVKDVCDANGVKCSGLSAHCPLMRPEISVPYLEKAIRFAEVLGAPVVNTDEGIRPSWLTDSECYEVMRYTLKTVLRTAERHGILRWHRTASIHLQDHRRTVAHRHAGGLADAAGELRHRQCVPWRRRSLCGASSGRRPGGSRSRQGHLHRTRRGREGESDGHARGLRLRRWRHRLEGRRTFSQRRFSGVLSVECGTPRQAERSLAHLRKVIHG